MTNFWYHVSLVYSYYDMVDPSAVLAYMLVKHIKEACPVIFSTHFFIPIRCEFMGMMKIDHDKEYWFFYFFFVFLRKFPKIFNWRFSALYCWQNKLRWALGSNFLKNIVLTEFQMIHFEKIWLWIKGFLPFRISFWLRD